MTRQLSINALFRITCVGIFAGFITSPALAQSSTNDRYRSMDDNTTA
jgi:hypothetical protein